MRLEILPLQEPVGALVHGWRPDEELTAQDRETIVAGLREHLVLVFRGHEQPSDAALVRFACHFGELVKGSEWFRDSGLHPAEILPVSNTVGADGVPEGTGGSIELEWHSDYSYVDRPGKESFLEAVELPDDPPVTSFCSQYVALETLPPMTIDRLRTLRAFHSITNLRRDGVQTEAQREYRAGFMAKRIDPSTGPCPAEMAAGSSERWCCLRSASCARASLPKYRCWHPAPSSKAGAPP